jgi:hypothetical protein
MSNNDNEEWIVGIFGNIGNIFAMLLTVPFISYMAILALPKISSKNPVNSSSLAQVCKVIDSTGTPLNVRDKPNGNTINSLKKDKEVYILETTNDEQNRSWVKIAGYHEGKYRTWGWAIKKYINC